MRALDLEIEISDDIDAVQADWAWLEKEGFLTPFQTRAWLLPLYKIIAPRLKAKPLFVILRDKTTHQPILLLPLCVRQRYGVSIIEFADFGVSDYNSPLISKTFTPTPLRWFEIWQKILAAFTYGAILRLEKMPRMTGERLNPLIQRTKGVAGLGLASWGITLPATIHDYDANALHPSFSKELKKKLRRVTKRGAIEYAVARTHDEKRVAFNILARQRQARFDEMGRTNILADPVYRQFYEAVAIESATNLAELGMLKVGGTIVGITFALNHHGALHVIMSTFESGEWKSASLGNVLIYKAIEHAIDNGISFFDLTIGNETYKQHFGATHSPLYSSLQPLTAAGSFAAVPMACYAQAKKIAKDIIESRNPIDTRFSRDP